MKIVAKVLSLCILLVAIGLCYLVITNSVSNQHHKSDYAELNSAKYGIFSIDAWKEQLLPIVSEQIDKMYVSTQTEQDLREHVSVVLSKMIDEAAAKIAKANSKTTLGRFKQEFIKDFVDIKDVKSGIPEYTTAVIRELKKPKTKKQLKTIVGSNLAELSEKTADIQDKSALTTIVESQGVKTLDEARTKLQDSIDSQEKVIVYQATALVLLCIIEFLLLALNRKNGPFHFLVVIASLFLLLAAGVATPMIDMEAKISQLKFVLVEHPILFQNQILYFQSKSIFNVFFLMITDPQLQMKAVGILVVSFSVIFPITKLISTVAYYFNVKRARDRTLIKFFVHKSGKWSMADVMVIAIFMAYIGFNGVLNSQLSGLNTTDSGIDVIATNGTSLQPGYFMFISYAIIALLVSDLLNPKAAEPTASEVPAASATVS